MQVTMQRILIVDDHALIRAGLEQVLQNGLGKPTIGEAESASEAMDAMHKQEWDMTIMDLTLPGRSGLDLLCEFKNLRPNMPVLVLSVLSEDEFAARVLKAGAAGFVHKETSADELVRAVRKVLGGHKYVSAAFAEKLASHIGAPVSDAPHEKLSDREFQVLTMLAKGESLTHIGKILSLSIKTISTYRARILQKMELCNNAELTRYALKHGLVD
jgi:two-component system, NarL family, invasion response regulator UvrY